jgi:putative ABC transport system permease protein
MVVAAITGIPLSYYAMNRWLENFAYRIPIGLEVFLISLLTGVILVALTVSYHSVRAALADPVKSIRYE